MGKPLKDLFLRGRQLLPSRLLLPNVGYCYVLQLDGCHETTEITRVTRSFDWFWAATNKGSSAGLTEARNHRNYETAGIRCANDNGSPKKRFRKPQQCSSH